MKGNLKSVETRTVYDQKVVRLTLDVPFDDLQRTEVNGEEALAYLNHKVGGGVPFELLDLAKGQSRLE